MGVKVTGVKKRLLVCLLLTGSLTACTKSAPPQPKPVEGPDNTISGTVTGQTLRLGSVALLDHTGKQLAQAKVGAGGELQLKFASVVPSGASLTAGFGEGCVGENSNPAARVFVAPSLTAYGPQGDQLGSVREVVTAGQGAIPDQSYLLRLYANAPVKFKGECVQGGGEEPRKDAYDLTFVSGWNRAMVTPREDGTFSFTNLPQDAQVALRFRPASPYVRVKLNPATVTLSGSAAVTVDAAFEQFGGYSGPVTLSTDLPGLQVEPSTLNLPALSAQTLGPQWVSIRLTFRYVGSETTLSRPFHLTLTNAAGQEVGSGQGQLRLMPAP